MKSCKIEKTKSLSVFCIGQELPYDHPRIYLVVNPETKKVTCPYCSKKFLLE